MRAREDLMTTRWISHPPYLDMKNKRYRSDNRKFWKKSLIEVEYTTHDCPVVQDLLLVWRDWKCQHCDHLCLNTEDTNT